jgi:hypothetical protein
MKDLLSAPIDTLV